MINLHEYLKQMNDRTNINVKYIDTLLELLYETFKIKKVANN